MNEISLFLIAMCMLFLTTHIIDMQKDIHLISTKINVSEHPSK